MGIYEQLKAYQYVPIQLIGLDMDGTVFNDAKEITARTRKAIADAVSAGITVLPATGRPKMGVPQAFLSIPGVRYCLCSNGAEVADLQTGEIIYRNCLPMEKVLELMPWFLERECTCELYIEDRVYSDERQQSFWEKAIPDPFILEYVRSTRTVVSDIFSFYQAHPQPVDKINTSFGDPVLMEEAYQWLDGRTDIVGSGGTPANIEINNAGCDKGEALLALGRLLGIGPEAVMACGDSTNDLAMIEKCRCGVAMGNARPEVKEAADVMTGTNEEDGVAQLLEAVIRLNRELVSAK